MPKISSKKNLRKYDFATQYKMIEEANMNVRKSQHVKDSQKELTALGSK